MSLATQGLKQGQWYQDVWDFLTETNQFSTVFIGCLSFSHVMGRDQWIFTKEVFI